METGENVDDADVVHEALRLLTEQDREREALRAALQVGLDDIEAGRVVPWTPTLLDEIKREVQAEMASERSAASHEGWNSTYRLRLEEISRGSSDTVRTVG